LLASEKEEEKNTQFRSLIAGPARAEGREKGRKKKKEERLLSLQGGKKKKKEKRGKKPRGAGPRPVQGVPVGLHVRHGGGGKEGGERVRGPAHGPAPPEGGDGLLF